MNDLNTFNNLKDLTINYYRFQFNLESHRPSLQHANHNVFITILDSIKSAVNFLHLEELKIQVELWLEQHYGACVVRNKDGKIIYQKQNDKEFIEQMKECGIKACIQDLDVIK